MTGSQFTIADTTGTDARQFHALNQVSAKHEVARGEVSLTEVAHLHLIAMLLKVEGKVQHQP